MKKQVLTITILLLTIFSFSQEKLFLSGKVGYAGIGNGKWDGISSQVQVSYNFHKNFGAILGFTNMRGNNFPNENGIFITGEYEFDKMYHDYSSYNKGRLTQELLNQYQEYGIIFFDTFSGISFDFGLHYYLTKKENKQLLVSFQGRWTNQYMHTLLPIKITFSEAPLEATIGQITYQYNGLGYGTFIEYRKRVYKKLFAGIYAEFSWHEDGFVSQNVYNFGLSLSVGI